MKDSEQKRYRFITAKQLSELDGMGQKVLFCIWNSAALLLSSLSLCVVSLNFAIGRFEIFYIYLGYFRVRDILLLNWLPILFLQVLFYVLFNRQWLAFLTTGTIGLAMSIGNYFKLIFRSDPFTFSDMTSIKAGLTVAGNYDIQIDWRIMVAILFMIVATLILFLFAKARIDRLGIRLMLAACVLFASWYSWNHCYTDSARYYDNAYTNFLHLTRDTRDNFISNGFYYPFLFSVTQSDLVPPSGYDETETEALYSEYENQVIPGDQKINVMVLQLESFCDLEAAGFPGISEDIYKPLRQLQEESWSGTMVASVIGGGTVVTERAVLTGACREQNYFKPAYSYVRYLRSQGYFCTASHPNVSSFYARRGVNEYLGFDMGYYLDEYFRDITGGEWNCDAEYLPEVFRLFREGTESNQPLFSFNVSLQGHTPYNNESFDREDNLWIGDGVSDSTRFMLNNYLSKIKETQTILLNELEQVKDFPEPMVFLIYGDHKTYFYDDQFYEDLGISYTMENEKGMVDYLGTPYLIWANQAAKAVLQDDMTGEGPMTSPGYLMNLLFNKLGWKGPAFMQFTEEIRRHLSVICTKGGYIEDGVYTQELSENGQELLNRYQDMQYYIRYRPELAG